MGPHGFGRIERDGEHSVEIRYSEGQMYPPELWSTVWVKRFETLEEAV